MVGHRFPRFDVSLQVMSEDSSLETCKAMSLIARSVLRCLVPEEWQWSDRVDIQPRDELLSKAIRGSRWKTYQGMTDLARAIASKILEKDGFVFLHIDADRCWKDRERNPSENYTKFKGELVTRVRRLVRDKLEKSNRKDEEDAILSRLMLLMPYYSSEAWFYQNTRKAAELCHKHFGGKHAKLFEEDWEQDRSALDNESKIKDKICLGGTYNRELAQGFPADQVFKLDASFTESVMRALGCSALGNALKPIS